VNRTPLISRLPKLPWINYVLFTNDNYRPRSQLLNSGYTAGGTSLVLRMQRNLIWVMSSRSPPNIF